MKLKAFLTAYIWLLLAATAFAGALSGLTDFTAETTISSAEMNGNFASIETEVTDNDSRIDTLLTYFTSTDANTALALAANGGNCSAGSYPLGIDASGAAEGCTDATTEIGTVALALVNLKSAASSTDNGIARFDSTAGDVQDSGVTIDDSNNLTVPGSITAGGTDVPTCLIFRDSDDAGDSACSVLNGVMTCETDTNGVCDDAT